MLLYPSSSSTPWDTTFRNVEGQIIYKTEFLMRYGLIPRQITIKRIVPSNSFDLEIGNEDTLRDSFTDLAEIRYEIFSSRIRYNGTEMSTSDFFRKSGFIGRWELVDSLKSTLIDISPRNLQRSGFYRSRWQRVRMGAETQCMQSNKWSLIIAHMVTWFMNIILFFRILAVSQRY